MTAASPWRVATVSSGRPTGSRGRVLELAVAEWPGNFAGQHVDVRLTAEDGYQAVRSYSLASSGAEPVIELAVDEIPDGEVSPYLVEDIRPGDQVEIRGPIGAYFVWTPDRTEPVQLIAGGSGIVPMMAIARAHERSGSSAPMRLLYAVRSASDAFYLDDIDRLTGNGLVVDWAYSRVAPPGFARPAGRVDAATIVASTFTSSLEPSVYVCGPTGFVEAVADLLVLAGHAPDRIRTERFGGA